MSAKSIFIVVITVFLTVILMNNNQDMSFWIFGEAKVSKLGVLAGIFFAGWLIGFLMGRPKAKSEIQEEEDYISEPNRNRGLSEEDQDYIS